MQKNNLIALVTGSSSGIGRSIAIHLAEKGYTVVVHSNLNTQGGRETTDQIANMGGSAYYINADLTHELNVESLFNQIVAKYGTLHILINNAGRTNPMIFDDSTADHWQEQFQTNFFSTVYCSQKAVKLMKNNDYSNNNIINIASIRGLSHGVRPGIIAYCAAKAATINFTKTLAKHLAPDIRVNAIAPGIVNTPYLKTIDKELVKEWLDSVPLGSFLSPKDIAEAILFLINSKKTTGEILVMDGGATL